MRYDPTEMIELVDEEGGGAPVGSATRDECHSKRRPLHRSVHVLVFDSGGRLYLQKRSMSKATAPGMWDSSVGGHSRPGEAPGVTARRESLEEVGLVPGAMRQAFVWTWEGDAEREFVHTYVAEHDGPFEPDADEIEEGRFWSMGEIEEALGTGAFSGSFESEFAILKERRRALEKRA